MGILKIARSGGEVLGEGGGQLALCSPNRRSEEAV